MGESRKAEARRAVFDACCGGEGGSGTAQELSERQLRKVDTMSGPVVRMRTEVDVPAPTHAGIAELVRRIERPELVPSRDYAEAL